MNMLPIMIAILVTIVAALITYRLMLSKPDREWIGLVCFAFTAATWCVCLALAGAFSVHDDGRIVLRASDWRCTAAASSTCDRWERRSAPPTR